MSEAMERAFGVVLAGRKMRPERFELPTSDLKSDALPLRHGGQRCQSWSSWRIQGRESWPTSSSGQGRDNLGSNPSAGILEQAWNCWAKAGCITSARCARSLMKEASHAIRTHDLPLTERVLCQLS